MRFPLLTVALPFFASWTVCNQVIEELADTDLMAAMAICHKIFTDLTGDTDIQVMDYTMILIIIQILINCDCLLMGTGAIEIIMIVMAIDQIEIMMIVGIFPPRKKR